MSNRMINSPDGLNADSSIKITNVVAYLHRHKHDLPSEAVKIVRKIVKYLRSYKVAPKHYTIDLAMDSKCAMIQIDEQEGYIDRQVSKTEFEFINGTCFSIDFDKIPDVDKSNQDVKRTIGSKKLGDSVTLRADLDI